MKDPNHLYCILPAVHHHDFNRREGFKWIDCHDAVQPVLSYLRRDEEGFVVIVLNFTPVPRTNYQLGVPQPGIYLERFNSASTQYSRSNVCNSLLDIPAENISWMGRPYSITLTLPPLGGCFNPQSFFSREVSAAD